MRDEPRQPSAEPHGGPSDGSDTRRESKTDPLRRSRVGGAWIGIVVMGIVVLLLIVFIAQNTESVGLSFFAWDGDFPLAVAILAAAVGGFLVAATAGSLRIWQLRRRVRRADRSVQT